MSMSKFEVNSVGNGESGVLDFTNTVKCVVISFVISIVLLFISAVLITYSPVPDSAAKAVVMVISVISVIISGFLAAKKSRRQGWLSGAAAGFMYAVILYLIGSLIVLDFSIKISTLIMVVIGFLFGAFGGIIGINTGYKRRR